jgi:hypothetical protein
VQRRKQRGLVSSFGPKAQGPNKAAKKKKRKKKLKEMLPQGLEPARSLSSICLQTTEPHGRIYYTCNFNNI